MPFSSEHRYNSDDADLVLSRSPQLISFALGDITMRSITARDAQVFVAGALAGQGLRALLHLPHTMAISQSPVFPMAEAIGALALPLGIAILIRNVFAVTVAYVYLWLDVLFGCAVLTVVSSTSGLRMFQDTIVRDVAVTTAGQVVLLSLLFWSRRRQRRDDETTTPNQTRGRVISRNERES